MDEEDLELLEELEEALILSDVGPTTATNIIDKLRLTIKRNKSIWSIV